MARRFHGAEVYGSQVQYEGGKSTGVGDGGSMVCPHPTVMIFGQTAPIVDFLRVPHPFAKMPRWSHENDFPPNQPTRPWTRSVGRLVA